MSVKNECLEVVNWGRIVGVVVVVVMLFGKISMFGVVVFVG